MAQLWDAEKTIEPPQALQLVASQFPNLNARRIRLLGAGWDNSAFLINEELIFRFPRRQIAVPLLETEWSLLPRLSKRLPLPIPVPEWKGAPTPNFPWPFIGYKMLPGLTACFANLSETERAALAEPIAHFLAALHAAPATEISDCRILNDHATRINAAHLIPKILEQFKDLSSLHLLENKNQLESIVLESKNCRPPILSSIVHGDFYVRHLLVDENHRLCGIIDWGDVHKGDPAIDLAIAHSFLPLQAHEQFKEAYGGIDEETWRLARLRAIHSSCWIILFGHHTDIPDLLREGLRSLNEIAKNTR